MKTFNDFVNSKRRTNEAEDLKKEYEEVFKGLLDKYEVDSPAELSDDKKSEFFSEISKYYTAGKGKTEKGEELTKEGKDEDEDEDADENAAAAVALAQAMDKKNEEEDEDEDAE